MFVVCGREVSMRMVYTSSPLTGVLKYAPQLFVGKDLIVSLRLIQWFRLIVENRPSYDENVETLTNINDIRNGILAHMMIHHGFDLRRIAILKV